MAKMTYIQRPLSYVYSQFRVQNYCSSMILTIFFLSVIKSYLVGGIIHIYYCVYGVFFSLLRGCESVLIFLGRTIYFLLGFHTFSVKGRQVSVLEAPLMCIAPHSSFLDGFVFFMGNALPSTVSKAENTNIPFFGSMYSAECTFIFHYE